MSSSLSSLLGIATLLVRIDRLRAQSGNDFRTVAVAWQTAWARTG